MHRVALLALLLVSAVTLTAPAPLLAQKADPVPKRETYLCPHNDATSIDCYLDAVDHLYTMCRVTKSIEIIEFGYEKATQGTNGAKSEYCLIKQRLNMAKPYQAALHDAAISQQATEAMKSLQDYWLTSMQALEWRPPETDDEYKARTMVPYDRFKERISGIKEIMDIVKTRTKPAPAAAPSASKKGKR